MTHKRAPCDGCEHQLWHGQRPRVCNLSATQFPRSIQRQDGEVISWRVFPHWEMDCAKIHPEKVSSKGCKYLPRVTEALTEDCRRLVDSCTLLNSVYRIEDNMITWYTRTWWEMPSAKLLTSAWEPWDGA